MPLPCESYLTFYQILPMAILAATSIFGIYFIYALQKRENKLENIMNEIDAFRVLLFDFIDLTGKVRYQTHDYRRPRSPHGQDLTELLNIPLDELIRLEKELIQDYSSYEKGRSSPRSYMKVLVDLEILQDAVYQKFLFFTRIFLREDESEIDLSSFDHELKKFIPFSNEIDGIHTGIVPLIDPIAKIYEEMHRVVCRIFCNLHGPVIPPFILYP